MTERVEMELGGRRLIVETGQLAKQADGAALVQYGDTVVLVTAVMSQEPRKGTDFLPLYVDYRERTYAAGEIPGGFFKREGRPNEKETITSRRMDRPIRPLFQEGLRNEVQIMGIVLSADKENDPDVPAIIGVGAALAVSPIPFPTILSAVRVGRVDGGFVINPTHEQIDKGDLDLVVAGTREAVTMVEGFGKEVSDEVLLDAVKFGRAAVGQVIDLVDRLAGRAGRAKVQPGLSLIDPEVEKAVAGFASEETRRLLSITDHNERRAAREAVAERMLEHFRPVFGAEKEFDVVSALHKLEVAGVRKMICEEGRRTDGRGPRDLRPITCEVGVLPRTHGSALFTRGQTQTLSVTTLGTAEDEQVMEELKGESSKAFMLHYNFPPFSVGEVKQLRGPDRREVGHGALAEKALWPVLPSEDVFPYTIRIVSDILESNGSSSMATVCGGSLSLMDAGVPVKAAVAGLATGMVSENGKTVFLTDIAGIEDHSGDMDLKIAGTRKGITALQMDIKVAGISDDVLSEAVKRSHEARMEVLDRMDAVISAPRSEISCYAPRITTIRVSPDKIGTIIGPGGKTIRSIEEKTGAEINIDDEDPGRVMISAVDCEAAKKAADMIQALVADVEVGKVYTGKVKRIVDFGAFVEILPGKEGLVRISQLAIQRVEKVEDVVKVGDEIEVKVMEIDSMGRVNLSRRALLPGGEQEEYRPTRRPPGKGPPHRGRGSGRPAPR